MKISWSLSGMTKGVKGIAGHEKELIGKEIYVDRYTAVGRITGIDISADKIYGEVPDREYKHRFVDSRGLRMCYFEVEDLEHGEKSRVKGAD